MPFSAPPRSPVSSWRGSALRLTDPGCAIPASIDLDQPRLGIGLASASGGAADTLLGLDLRCDSRLTDHWVRGDDVIAVYETADARRLRSTAMWRLSPADGATRAWQLVLSTQTGLLHSDAVLAVMSEIGGVVSMWGTSRDGTVHWRDEPTPEATCVLVPRGGGPGSAETTVLVAAHPGDARRVDVRMDGTRTIVACWLFSTALEKGVLLRSRVLAAVGPSATATHWGTRLASTFAASPPMLTT